MKKIPKVTSLISTDIPRVHCLNFFDGFSLQIDNNGITFCDRLYFGKLHIKQHFFSFDNDERFINLDDQNPDFVYFNNNTLWFHNNSQLTLDEIFDALAKYDICNYNNE